MAMRNTESSEFSAVVHFTSKPAEEDEVHYAKTDLLKTNEAEEGVHVDESGTESDQLLEDSTIPQNLIGNQASKFPTKIKASKSARSSEPTQDLSTTTELAYNCVKKVIKKFEINLEDSSSETPAYFGFLKFVDSIDGHKKEKDADTKANDDEKNDRLSSFIHLAASTRAFAVAKLIEAYQLPAPDFILSIQTGDDYGNNVKKEKFGIQVETERAIQRGLTATAKITHPWVTTSCIDQDMIRLVENALHHDMSGTDVPCIGFCNWEHVAGHQQLRDKRVPIPTSFDTRLQMDDMDNEQSFIHEYNSIPEKDIETDRSLWYLEPNHTHFHLFDDGTNNVQNVLLRRQEIEHELSISKVLRSPVVGYQPESTIFDNYIPVVMLLLGGDFMTLAAICKGLKDGTPIVVIRNTGGLADIVAQLCRKLSPTDELAQFRKKTYIEECKSEMKSLCSKEGNITEQQVIKIQQYIDVLNEMEELIIVFDAIEHSGNLEDAIANGILNSIKYRVENFEQFFRPETISAELEWCLMWNKDDHAQQLLIDRKDPTIASVNDKAQNKNHINSLVQQLLFKALYRNNVLFVRLLMEYGAAIEDLTPEQLNIICIKTLNEDSLPVDSAPYEVDAQKMELRVYVEQRYQSYLQQYLRYDIMQINDTEKAQTIKQLLCGRGKDHENNVSWGTIFNDRQIEALYLWFIFMNQPDMAKYLCSRSRNQTVATLLAAKIYFKAAQITKIAKNKSGFKEVAKQFDQHAREIIDQCFIKDNSFAVRQLNTKAVAFYNCIPLDIARRANCKTFLASNTVQKYLDDKWYHHFDQQQRVMKIPISIWICLASLILPLVPISSILFPFLYAKNSINSKQVTECGEFLSNLQLKSIKFSKQTGSDDLPSSEIMQFS